MLVVPAVTSESTKMSSTMMDVDESSQALVEMAAPVTLLVHPVRQMDGLS